MILETKGLSINFGGIKAVNNLDMAVSAKELRGLIGPNGSGKSTAFNLITGFYRPTSGTVLFDGRDISGQPPYKIVSGGISRTFQNLRLFKEMTVLENVMVGHHSHTKVSFMGAVFKLSGSNKEEKRARERAREILDAMGLGDKERDLAGSLPYGVARLVEIARAWCAEPKLLLLDEPAAGMNPQETENVMQLIRKIGNTGISVILVEHDMAAVMKYCDTITVMDHGKKIAEGTPHEVQNNDAVIEAYLGKRRLKHA